MDCTTWGHPKQPAVSPDRRTGFARLTLPVLIELLNLAMLIVPVMQIHLASLIVLVMQIELPMLVMPSAPLMIGYADLAAHAGYAVHPAHADHGGYAVHPAHADQASHADAILRQIPGSPTQIENNT